MPLVWPLPALLGWLACWIAFLALRGVALPVGAAPVLAALLGAAIAVTGSTPWRRLFIGAGFPLSLAASGLASEAPAWAWLAPLAALALVYPIGTWRDAPVFPTPRGALRGLADELPLPARASILDAGCGLGDALRELHATYPDAALTGIEWSRPLRLLCAMRCRYAQVRRADLWAADWSAFDLVYLFQRPESMARAAAKAAAELRPGAWLGSLEFPVPGRQADRVFRCPDGRPLWLYRQGSKR
jgi:SAM-dependent methyltransferase